MSKDKQPEIRFPGFTEDWEERKLDEIFGKIRNAFVGTATPYYVDEGHFYLESNNVKDGRINRNTEVFINDEFYEKQKDKWLHTNDIVMVQSGHVGHTAVIPEDLDKTAAHALIMFSNYKTKTSPFFLNYQFQTLTAKRKLENITTGNTIKHILASEMKKFEVTIPEHVEQQKIGSFFKQLDDTIALHQRKLDLLKETKKGFLQKMFPKNGAKVPEIRFPGFTEDWEQRKFFDNIKSTIDFRGRTPKKLGMDWSTSGYLALSALNVKNGYIDPSADAHYGDQELYNKWMSGKELYEGQVLFTTEAPMGNVAQVPDNNKYILSQRTIAFDVNSDKITDDFLAVLLRSPKSFNELSSLASGGTAKGVSQKSLSQFKVTLPNNLEEQKKIGTFFKQLDTTIALHQRKLDLLKETKKGFLQKMFV